MSSRWVRPISEIKRWFIRLKWLEWNESAGLYTPRSLIRKRKVYTRAKRKEITKWQEAGDQALFRYDNIAALDWPWQIGPLNCDVAEVHRNAGAHQRVGLVAEVEVQMRLGRIAR